MTVDRQNMSRELSTPLNSIGSMTIRARAAYLLVIAEYIFQVVNPDHSDYPLARAAFEGCWSWVAGSNLSAWEVYCLHTDENMNLQPIGLGFTAYDEPDPIQQNIWYYLDGVVMYIAWHLFKYERNTIPADLELEGEGFVDEVIRTAIETNRFEESQYESLKQYLLETYPATEPDELGSPITREEVMAHLSH
jgi:Immunity protein Imm6